VSNTFELLESRIRKTVEELKTLRRENERLKGECETLKSQIALTTGESRKVQRVLADYEQLKRTHELVTGRVERALNKLNALRLQ
jgi:septation ring formation regulator EzrA